jgi:uncharacterized protein YbjT (DUF2867 family)
MTSTVLVTGGTGTLGRPVVSRLREAGHDVRVLTRQHVADAGGIRSVTGDLVAGQGIEPAVQGAEIIVHCAGSSKGDIEAARNLVRAAGASATPPHLVSISVVGADRVPMAGRIDRTMFGYFGMKWGAEQVVKDSGLPWTTLRATQFYDLILLVASKLAKLPAMPSPSGFRFQPVDTGEVATRMVELSLGEPAGLVPDLGGPRVYDAADLFRGYLRATHRRRPIVPVRLPGQAARAIRAGAILPSEVLGRRTWEEFLADHVGQRRR